MHSKRILNFSIILMLLLITWQREEAAKNKQQNILINLAPKTGDVIIIIIIIKCDSLRKNYKFFVPGIIFVFLLFLRFNCGGF